MESGLRVRCVQVALGLMASGQSEQMPALDEIFEELRRDQPTWRVEVGRAATTRTIQFRAQAPELDEALQLVKTELERLLRQSSLVSPPNLRWARPRQVTL